MLSSTVFLYGDSHLQYEFVARILAILPSALRIETSIQMLQSDEMKFDYKPDETLTHIKDVKKDFYRFPSIILFALKILHRVQASSVWETIDCLIARGILSLVIGGSVRVALSISMFARLSVYCHHSSQDDRMTILQPTQQSKGTLWAFPRKLVIHYFLHCAPLNVSTDSFTSGAGIYVDDHTLIWPLYSCDSCDSVCKRHERPAWSELDAHADECLVPDWNRWIW